MNIFQDQLVCILNGSRRPMNRGSRVLTLHRTWRRNIFSRNVPALFPGKYANASSPPLPSKEYPLSPSLSKKISISEGPLVTLVKVSGVTFAHKSMAALIVLSTSFTDRSAVYFTILYFKSWRSFRIKTDALYLSVNVFSTKVLIKALILRLLLEMGPLF